MSDIQEIILDEVRNVRSELQDHRRESSERHDKMDGRVRSVESWQAEANGKITAFGTAGVILGGVITWVTGLFKS